MAAGSRRSFVSDHPIYRHRCHEGIGTVLKALPPLRGIFFLEEIDPMKRSNTKKLVYSALFLALALVLPFLTGQIQTFGQMLAPMHLPVLLCGFLCGPVWGLAVGAVAPLLRSLMFSMPPMFPTALAMAFELAAYGLFSGLFYRLLRAKRGRSAGKKNWGALYASLVLSMLLGRIVWGCVMFALMAASGGSFGMAAFLAGAFTSAWPGILVQLVAVPAIVYALERAGHADEL